MKKPKFRVDPSDLLVAAGLGGLFYGLWLVYGQGWAALVTGGLVLALGLLTSRPDSGK